MDRRTFLKRSGVGVGAGIAASQLSLVQKAVAEPSKAMLDGKGKVLAFRQGDWLFDLLVKDIYKDTDYCEFIFEQASEA